MSIRSIIIKYKDINDTISEVYKCFDAPKYKYLNSDITISCKYDNCKDLFGGHYVKIYVDKILVYEDYFIHDIPKEMKQQIKLEVSNIKKWNKEQIKSGLYEKHDDILKERKIRKKEAEKLKFMNEQKYLIDKYKS